MIDGSRDDSSIQSVGNTMPPPIAAPPGYPKQFGNYVLLSPLAAGGMGEVFLASSAIGGALRLVVIKTLRPDLVTEPGYVRRFQDEARIALELSHKNVSQVFDVGVCDGVHFIAMEHIAGATLRRILAAGDMPPAVSLLIAVEVLEGLASAHNHKHPLTHEPRPVVHRDVSPHNVMVSYDGDVKLIDFGLAWSETKQERTGNDVVLGKISYMSPEQARGDQVDGRSDQYSFAIVLYEMLAGERFYGEMTPREVWLIAGSTAHKPTHFDALSGDLRAVLERALSYDVANRFNSCSDFADALRAILRERYPGTDKSTLRAFIASILKTERADAELSLRGMAPAALSAISSSRAIDAVPNTVATVHDHEPIPETTGVMAQKATSKTALLAATIAISVVVIAGIAALVHSAGEQPNLAAAVAAKPVEVKRVDEKPVEAKPVEPMEPVAPVVDEEPPAPKATPKPKPKPIAKPAPVPAPSRESSLPPDWRSWPMEAKVQALAKSNAGCAKVLLKLRANGNELQVGAVDACLSSL